MGELVLKWNVWGKEIPPNLCVWLLLRIYIPSAQQIYTVTYINRGVVHAYGVNISRLY